MKCTGCGHVTTSRTARFCPSCGAELPSRVIDLTEAKVPAARAPAEVEAAVAAGNVWAPPAQLPPPPVAPPPAPPVAPPPVAVEPPVLASPYEPYAPLPAVTPPRPRPPIARHAGLIVAGAGMVVAVVLGSVALANQEQRGTAIGLLVAGAVFALVPVVVAAVRRSALPLPFAAVAIVALVLFGAPVLRSSCDERLGPNADLASCGFARADFSGRDLHGANLAGADLTGANLRSANLTGANLRGAKLSRANATSTRFADADLTGAVLDDATLTNATLTGATVREVSLRRVALGPEANLSGLDLSGANLAGADLPQLVAEDVTLRDANLDGANLLEARLSNADLDGASLRDVTLNQASLDGASLHGAKIEGSRLVGAFLGGADLGGATIEDSDLAAADLRDATLTGATLSGLRLNGASLLGTKGLDDATLAKAVGVSSAALGPYLTTNRIRLESRDTILTTLGGACRGAPVPGASARQGSFHPLVIRDAGGGSSAWTEAAANAGWEPMATRFGQQVACVQETQTNVQRCRYTEIGGLGRSGSLTRYRHSVRLRVFDAKTGSLRLDRTFQGSQPDACPAVTSFQSNGRIDGTTPDFATARPALEGVVGKATV